MGKCVKRLRRCRSPNWVALNPYRRHTFNDLRAAPSRAPYGPIRYLLSPIFRNLALPKVE